MISLVSPFPLNRLPDCYRWFYHSNAFLNGRNTSQADFISLISATLASSLSWGVLEDGELVGFIQLEPLLLPGQSEIVDGLVTIALDRSVWGNSIIQEVGHQLIPEVFAAIPPLLRISAWTLESNKPARQVAIQLGFTHEGTVRHALVMDGKLRNTVLYGLTRGEYNGQRP